MVVGHNVLPPFSQLLRRDCANRAISGQLNSRILQCSYKKFERSLHHEHWSTNPDPAGRKEDVPQGICKTSGHQLQHSHRLSQGPAPPRLLKMSILLNTSTDYLVGRTTIRHHRDLYYTEKEGILISNFRNLSPDMQQVLINISSCLRFTPHKERSFWKQD